MGSDETVLRTADGMILDDPSAQACPCNPHRQTDHLTFLSERLSSQHLATQSLGPTHGKRQSALPDIWYRDSFRGTMLVRTLGIIGIASLNPRYQTIVRQR